jgi:hypothetical protein
VSVAKLRPQRGGAHTFLSPKLSTVSRQRMTVSGSMSRLSSKSSGSYRFGSIAMKFGSFTKRS